jgi:DNA modification methylase
MKLDILYNKSSERMSEIDDNSVDLMVTSPPYNIDISYGNTWKNRKITKSKGHKYKDAMPENEYKDLLKTVFDETKRVLKKNGSIYLNMKSRLIKNQLVPPFWVLDYFSDMYLKNIIIWNFDWGGATDKRFSSRYEFIFFFTKNPSEWIFNLDDIKIPSVNFRPDRYKTQLKNPSDVWKIPLVSGNNPERTEHPAQYPEKLIERIIKVASNPGSVVLDPFIGSGTTAVVAKKLGRRYIGYDISQEYIKIANNRLTKVNFSKNLF